MTPDAWRALGLGAAFLGMMLYGAFKSLWPEEHNGSGGKRQRCKQAILSMARRQS